MDKRGTITFQANDNRDIFYVADVIEDGLSQPDAGLMHIDDPQFEANQAWVTGYVPQLKPVNIEGDTVIIHAFFKAEGAFIANSEFRISIYLEYEEVEALVQEKE